MAKKSTRKKTNYMIEYSILEGIDELVPAGQRSDFVNRALEKGLSLLKRKIAFKEMDKLKNEYKLKLSDKEILRLKQYGRD